MKGLRKILLMIVVIMLGVSSTMAQTGDNSHRFVIKTNPLAALGGPFWVTIVPVTGEYKVLFEARTMPKQSITLGASYLGPSLLLNLDELTNEGEEVSGVKTSGFRGQLMYKFFLSRDTEAPEGLYVGPHFSYASASIASKDNTSNKINMMKMNFNGIIGYQLITSGGFALDVFTGLGVKSSKWTPEGDSEEIFDVPFQNKAAASVAFGFSFGYAF
ncbi:MAG TPA: hypothetical protein ENH59_01530 [Bacteroidetes bacterium]|nr:hypothetical protein [Bacteroidota bacterium]